MSEQAQGQQGQQGNQGAQGQQQGGQQGNQGAQGQQQGGQQGNGAWYATMGLDAGQQQFLHTKGIDGVPSLVKNAMSAAELIGKKGVILPAETDPPERWTEYHKAIGAVEAPDKFEIPTIDGAKPSDFENRMMSAMRPAFVKAGLTQRQINTLVKEGYHTFAKGELATLAAQQQSDTAKGEAEIAALRTELGPKADAFIAGAQRAARALLGKDPAFAGDLDKLLGAGRFVRLMGMIGENYREGSPALNAGQQQGFAMTKEQAVVEIAHLNGDATKMAILQDKNHPEYAIMTQRRDELYRLAYPEQAAA